MKKLLFCNLIDWRTFKDEKEQVSAAEISKLPAELWHKKRDNLMGIFQKWQVCFFRHHSTHLHLCTNSIELENWLRLVLVGGTGWFLMHLIPLFSQTIEQKTWPTRNSGTKFLYGPKWWVVTKVTGEWKIFSEYLPLPPSDPCKFVYKKHTVW